MPRKSRTRPETALTLLLTKNFGDLLLIIERRFSPIRPCGAVSAENYELMVFLSLRVIYTLGWEKNALGEIILPFSQTAYSSTSPSEISFDLITLNQTRFGPLSDWDEPLTVPAGVDLERFPLPLPLPSQLEIIAGNTAVASWFERQIPYHAYTDAFKEALRALSYQSPEIDRVRIDMVGKRQTLLRRLRLTYKKLQDQKTSQAMTERLRKQCNRLLDVSAFKLGLERTQLIDDLQTRYG